MRRIARTHSKAIFRQLSQTEGATGVKTIIENHDAWLHNADVQAEITVATRLAVLNRPRGEVTAQRIARQRQSLAALTTRLPHRLSHAG